jgi:hypothetical protein
MAGAFYQCLIGATVTRLMNGLDIGHTIEIDLPSFRTMLPVFGFILFIYLFIYLFYKTPYGFTFRFHRDFPKWRNFRHLKPFSWGLFFAQNGEIFAISAPSGFL